MKKHLFFLSVLLSSLFLSCEKNDDTFDLSSTMQIYGTDIPIKYGVIWQSTQNTILERVEYVWKDIYVDSEGVTKTDNVVGYFKSNNKIETGNFMLSLYGDGLNYISQLATTKGAGALICLHMASSDLTQLAAGKYKFDDTKLANSFTGYLSTSYSMDGEKGNLATIIDGDVNVSKEGDNYIVDLNVKLSSGLLVSCKYNGKLENSIVSQPKLAKTQGIALHGLLPIITRITRYNPAIFGPMPDAVEESIDVVNKAFFSVSSGVTQNSTGNKESVEIALALDNTTKEFTFISPIKARSILGHLSSNNFPCHTKFMRAPATFTDSDYENVEKIGINFTMVEENVKFAIANFTPGYVFFEAGNGTNGVIYVKGVGSPFEIVTDVFGIIFNYDMTSEQLLCDIKATTNYGNPKIR